MYLPRLVNPITQRELVNVRPVTREYRYQLEGRRLIERAYKWRDFAGDCIIRDLYKFSLLWYTYIVVVAPSPARRRLSANIHFIGLDYIFRI